jgi:DNA adenine methylase
MLYFRERLARLKGRWLVTLNDAPEIRRAFAGCEIRSIERAKGIGGERVYKELVITPKGEAA